MIVVSKPSLREVLLGDVVHAKDAFAHHGLRRMPPVSPDWSPVITFRATRDA